MNLSFTTFNPTQPAGWVANPATGTRAGQLSRACIGLMYLLLMGVAAQAQTTWTGTAGTDWNTDGNWDPAGVPTAATDVVIPNVSNLPRIEAGTAAVANSVHVQGGAALTIGSSGSLTINGSKSFISTDGFAAFYNQGTVNNSGQLVIGNAAPVGEDGLFNEGRFNNNAGGQIQIDRSTRSGLFNVGSFTNAAGIVIGATASVGEYGLYNQAASFSNDPGGHIRIDRSATAGLFTRGNAGSFVNAAGITIGGTAAVGQTGLVNQSSRFRNNPGGTIRIDRSTSTGLSNVFSFRDGGSIGFFTNAASIIIGGTAAVGQTGLFNQVATFNNNPGGTIQIDRSTSTGLSNIIFASFTNEASILIGANAPVGPVGLDSRDEFTNKGCSAFLLLGSNSVLSGGSNFSNSGTILENATGDSNIGTNTGLVQNLNGGTFSITANTGLVTTSAGKIWTGCTDTDWNTAGNWSGNAVPAPADDVVISNVSNFPRIGAGTAAVANSVHVRSTAALTIGNGGSLTINGSKTISDVIAAFYNQGTVNNSGQLVIGNVAPVGNYGLYNQNGTVNNNPGGTIRIDRSTLTGLHIGNGNFTNGGGITIGGTAGVGEFGLYNLLSTFSNNPGGTIEIDRTTNTGLVNYLGTFTNAGAITTGKTAGVGNNGLSNEVFAQFSNNPGGTIRIDRSSISGLYNLNSTFTNAGALTIGGTASVGDNGISNAGTFNNNPGGTIEIDRSTRTGLSNAGGIVFTFFTNEASMIVGANAPVGQYGLVNSNTFNNKGCATLQLFAPLNNTVNFSASFTNGGLFTVSTTGVHGNTGLLTNNGVIVYPQGNPIPNVINNELIVLPLTATGLTAAPALQTGSNRNFTVAATWYRNPQRTTVAGSYSSATNAFTAGSPGSYPVYFLVTDPANGCSLEVSIPLTATGGSLVTGPARLCVKAAPPLKTNVTLPLRMQVAGDASAYSYHWSYKAPNSTSYKPIAARGTSIGKVSFVPLANAAGLNIIGAKGNLNGLQGYLVRLTVKRGDQVVGSAQTLLDGSCPLTLPGAREGVFTPEEMQVRVYPNPVRDLLRVELRGLSGPAGVVLYDLKGQRRGHWTVEPVDGAARLEADASALSQGVYLLQVETADGVLHRQKVLKLR